MIYSFRRQCHPAGDSPSHHGVYLEQSELIRLLNAGAIQNLEAICRRGREANLFRADVSPLELHWQISATCFFDVSNRATFSGIFGDAVFTPEGQERLKRHLVEMVVGLALKPDRRPRR